MRIGIAGVGFMGSTHAAGWAATDAELVGFSAETPQEAQDLAAQYGARVFEDFEAMLDEVDVVDICVPTHLHAPLTILAAKRGKHVICEKPLARTVDEAKEMIAVCKAAGVQLFVAHVVRFFPEYASAKAVVDQGQIGRVATARYMRGSYRPKKPVGNWFLDEAKSGGILLDLMIHDLDYARWIGGEVESVLARKVSTAHPDSPIDYGMVILTHRSGAISHVAGAWAYPPPTFRTGFEISGDQGMIEFDSQSAAPIESLLAKPTGDAPDVGLPASPVAESPYTTQIKEFYAALTTGSPVRVSAADGLAAVQIALAAVESARSGQAVFIKDLAEVVA